MQKQRKTHGHRQQQGGHQREAGLERVKRVKYMVTEGDLTLAGEHTMQWTDDVL